MGTETADFSPISDNRTEIINDAFDQDQQLDDEIKPVMLFDEIVMTSPIKAKIIEMKAKMKLKRKNNRSIR